MVVDKYFCFDPKFVMFDLTTPKRVKVVEKQNMKPRRHVSFIDSGNIGRTGKIKYLKIQTQIVPYTSEEDLRKPNCVVFVECAKTGKTYDRSMTDMTFVS